MSEEQEPDERPGTRVRFNLALGAGIGMLIGAGLGLAFGSDPSAAVLGAAIGIIFGSGAGIMVS